MLTVLYGPPGTGKTTWLMRHLLDQLSRGVPSERIGFVSFTKAAVNEAKARASALVPDLRAPWFRTLHSIGYQLQGRPPQLGSTDATALFRTWGYRVKFDREGKAPELDGVKLQGDEALMHRWTILRCLSRSPEEAVARLDRETATQRVFVERYEGYKRDMGRIDFTDMLMRALDCAPPSLDVLYVDEAQDLNPLQIELTGRLMAHAEHVVVAGDDDQAIMRFQGAEPGWFQQLGSGADEVITLDQSYRIPAVVHEVAGLISGRIGQRVEKVYRPRAARGEVRKAHDGLEVMEMARAWLAAGQRVAYLCRTVNACSDAVVLALGAGVPFIAEGGAGVHPLQAPKQLQAALALAQVGQRGQCTAEQLSALLAHVDGLPRGVKAAVKRLPEGAVIDAWQASTLGLGRQWAEWTAVEPSERYKLLTRIPEVTRAYLCRVLDEEGRPPEVAMTICTQHASKGREWDHVIIDDSLPSPARRSLDMGGEAADDEHRVAYVAATRCKESLTVLSRVSSSRAVFRYEYPLVGAA